MDEFTALCRSYGIDTTPDQLKPTEANVFNDTWMSSIVRVPPVYALTAKTVLICLEEQTELAPEHRRMLMVALFPAAFIREITSAPIIGWHSMLWRREGEYHGPAYMCTDYNQSFSYYVRGSLHGVSLEANKDQITISHYIGGIAHGLEVERKKDGTVTRVTRFKNDAKVKAARYCELGKVWHVTYNGNDFGRIKRVIVPELPEDLQSE